MNEKKGLSRGKGKSTITPTPPVNQSQLGPGIPIDQVFAKLGRLQCYIDILIQQMTALENENTQLKEQLVKKE